MSTRLLIKFKVHPDKVEEFERIVSMASARVRAEDAGCEQYHMYRSIDDASEFVLVEAWTTQAALDAHSKSPAISEMQKIAPLLAARPERHRFED